jgi:hypothetical protein
VAVAERCEARLRGALGDAELVLHALRELRVIGRAAGVEVRADDAAHVVAEILEADGPPGPDAPCFVEVEDDERRSLRYGQWVERDDGHWVLRIPAL